MCHPPLRSRSSRRVTLLSPSDGCGGAIPANYACGITPQGLGGDHLEVTQVLRRGEEAAATPFLTEADVDAAEGHAISDQ
eukprot:9153736-Pyramimonas_sp.AAC.1